MMRAWRLGMDTPGLASHSARKQCLRMQVRNSEYVASVQLKGESQHPRTYRLTLVQISSVTWSQVR